MALEFGNRIAVGTSTTGTGTVTLGSAVSDSFMTFAEGGITDGATVHYLITEGNDFEIGAGTYTTSGTTLSRDTVIDSKISGTAGTTKMTLGGSAEVRVIADASDFGASSDVQIFEASGTWTKPAGATSVDVWCIGGGGGGGSGRRGASLSVRTGGGGGAGGAVSHMIFDAANISSSVTITVGAGGSGGAEPGADDTNGNNGSAGGNSSFGSYLQANGGNGGSGGTTSNALGGTGATGNVSSGDTGGNGGGVSAAGSKAFTLYPSGGAGGGGFNSSNARSAIGSVTVSSALYPSITAPADATFNTDGGDGVHVGLVNATGGAGGYPNYSGSNSTNGGDGAQPGGGGGGGAAGYNGWQSGAGGAGGDGIVVVITHMG